MYKGEKIFFHMVRILTFFSVAILTFIIFFIAKESIILFKQVSFIDFILGSHWNPTEIHPQVSIFPMILSTFYVSFVALIIVIPIGVGASIFLSSVVDRKVRNMIKPAIDLLAGIPSVIYGLMGLLVLVKFFEKHFYFPSGESVLVGGILLSIMTLPYMISTCDESMVKILERYKKSSDALGISKWHMIRYLVLPSSKKSILAGMILSFARSMGETMAVMMVIGNSPIFPKLFGKAQTIPSLIALEMGGAEVDSIHYHALFASGFVLMMILFIVNMIFCFLRNYINE
ncbi:phosphate ABC transporter permease subunit PstC [Inediibacterium massiliense]|uniref:phosphate ABC transporter permease subunit PstC n=1 Tax=Inediibacterium massiliense TaxID=1658111 RepID=UPI0006B69876|nr:phosphate ABC transporter permease subunit PstC [Inediibacterium massiliense]